MKLLPQAFYVQRLLNAALEALPHLGEIKGAPLLEAVKCFETTVALTTWGTEDVISRRTDNDDNEPLTDDQLLKVLAGMVNCHECSDDDWLYMDHIIDSVVGND